LQRAPSPATFVARLAASQAEARRISDFLTESLDPAIAACAAFEAADGGWQVEVHFVAPLDAEKLRALIALAAGHEQADALVCEPVAPRDWIAASLAGLPPVYAGRFVVHGAHDRARVPVNRIGIEIEAALAFGTGHHGTTRGCLLALDGLMKQRKKLRECAQKLHLSPLGRGRPPKLAKRAKAWRVRGNKSLESAIPPHPDPLPIGERGKSNRGIGVLDLGTGSGVLAIAAAKMLRTRVLASDIDRRAVRIARANAANNHVAALVESVHAAGLNTPRIVNSAPFDLVLANILLGPLQRLAAPLKRRLKPGARVVLSGLLPAHANAALSAYRAQGLALERRIVRDGWVTLVLIRPAAMPR
jgi:ribosomal protein L11 methyltransferase